MKAGASSVWVSSRMVCPLVGYALLLALVQFLVLVLYLHQVAPLASLHLASYLAGQVVHWEESPFLGSQGLELPVVLVLPYSSLVHQ